MDCGDNSEELQIADFRLQIEKEEKKEQPACRQAGRARESGNLLNRHAHSIALPYCAVFQLHLGDQGPATRRRGGAPCECDMAVEEV